MVVEKQNWWNSIEYIPYNQKFGHNETRWLEKVLCLAGKTTSDEFY